MAPSDWAEPGRCNDSQLVGDFVVKPTTCNRLDARNLEERAVTTTLMERHAGVETILAPKRVHLYDCKNDIFARKETHNLATPVRVPLSIDGHIICLADASCTGPTFEALENTCSGRHLKPLLKRGCFHLLGLYEGSSTLEIGIATQCPVTTLNDAFENISLPRGSNPVVVVHYGFCFLVFPLKGEARQSSVSANMVGHMRQHMEADRHPCGATE